MTVSSLVCELITSFQRGEEFTSQQVFELLKQDGATHAAVSGILHRLVRCGVLTIVRKDRLQGHSRKSYVFKVINPQHSVKTYEHRNSSCGFTRTDTKRTPLFKEEPC